MNQLKNQNSKNTKYFINYSLIPIALFFIFKTSIDKLLTTFIVDPILANCFPPSIIYDVSVSACFLLFSFPFGYRIAKGAKLPFQFYCLTVAYLFIYATYRIQNDPFQFTSFTIFPSIKLLDIISSIPGVFIVEAIILTAINKKQDQTDFTVQNSFGFAVDEVRKLDGTNDLLSRTKSITEVANLIKNTTTKDGSFPIGVVAKWGLGKSTFIQTLLGQFSSEDFIVIEFNVWKCSNGSQIIDTFFTQLKAKLKPYSFTITNKLQEYSSSLLKGTKNEGLNSLKNISEILMPIPSVENQYDNINEEIKRIGKKIIVAIDDLDRLDKKEIYEVIRLIRNTASFANTFFIVAYDRNYILNAIEEINPYQSHNFLEKIFQVEFNLAPISDSVIQSEITKRLDPILTAKGKEEYKKLINRGISFLDYGYGDLTTYFISNIRDVVRFVNSFKLNYEFVKDEIYLPDFYNLQLIRFKHPELYMDIYRKRNEFFTTDKERNKGAMILENSYSLKMIVKDNKETDISELKEFILQENSTYKLSNDEIDTISISFAYIFPKMTATYTSRKEILTYHLTVLKPSAFDRYFVLDIGNQLSEIEFGKLRKLPSKEFAEKLIKLAFDNDIIIEISERLSQIQEFDNKEDLIKVLSVIFAFADTDIPNRIRPGVAYNKIGFDVKVLATLIGETKNQGLYGTREEYKEFITSFLKTDENEYRFTDAFIRELIRSSYYFVSSLFSADELSEIALNNFKYILGKNSKLSYDIWMHYWGCELRKETPYGNGTTQVNYPRINEAKYIFRKFIVENDMDNFLLGMIRELPFDKRFVIDYRDSDSLKELFRSIEIFVWILKRYKGQSEYKSEFLKLYDDLKNVPEYKNGVEIDYFKTIPVRLRNDGE